MWNWLLRLADEARHSARSRRASVEQVVGRRGEDLAHRFLEKRGLRIVARNYRPPSGGGEIDLIGWDGETLVLVEVKCRTSDEAGAPERNVDADKVRQMQGGTSPDAPACPGSACAWIWSAWCWTIRR